MKENFNEYLLKVKPKKFKEYLYNGEETQLYTKHFIINVTTNDMIQFYYDDLYNIEKVQQLYPESYKSLLFVAKLKYLQHNDQYYTIYDLFPYFYFNFKNQELIDIVVIGIKEIQPSRYVVYLHCILSKR